MTTKPFAFALAMLIASHASAQSSSWTSTDVGAVTLAGSATNTNGVWTITGGGSDIWGTADSFQFLHQKGGTSGAITARVADLQDTNPFAKAGLMVRNGLGADAATVILDAKPGGGFELMWRPTTGAPMQFIIGHDVGLPMWLRLEWGRFHSIEIGVHAFTSPNGVDWTPIELHLTVGSAAPDVGVALTSHDSGQLTTAHVDHLSVDAFTPDWQPVDVGAVGIAGGAAEAEGVWTVSGAGGDIWGPADAFHFLHRSGWESNQHVRVRVNDLQSTSAFAKAGLMLRSTIDPDSPTVILDVKPDGGVEFMARTTWGGEMTFLDGLPAAGFPVWLDLSVHNVTPPIARAAVSKDGVSWTPLAGTPVIPIPQTLLLGVAVTSHDPSHATTSHLQGLTLLPLDAVSAGVSDDIGNTGLAGNATTDFTVCCPALIIEGAGADIWGTADSFEFVHGIGLAPEPADGGNDDVILSLDAANPFAKAGLMYRDGLDPGAPTVIVDVKPGGGIEFMARPCAGCDMMFIAGAQIGFPAQLFLTRNADGTFSAAASNGSPATRVDLGTTTVPMSNPVKGYAVTSHDTSRTARAVFIQAVQ